MPVKVGDRWFPSSGGQGCRWRSSASSLFGTVPDCTEVHATAQNGTLAGRAERSTLGHRRPGRRPHRPRRRQLRHRRRPSPARPLTSTSPTTSSAPFAELRRRRPARTMAPWLSPTHTSSSPAAPASSARTSSSGWPRARQPHPRARHLPPRRAAPRRARQAPQRRARRRRRHGRGAVRKAIDGIDPRRAPGVDRRRRHGHEARRRSPCASRCSAPPTCSTPRSRRAAASASSTSRRSEVFGRYAYHVTEFDVTTLGAVGEARWTYAVAKLATEHLAMTYHRQYGFPAVVDPPVQHLRPAPGGRGRGAPLHRARAQGRAAARCTTTARRSAPGATSTTSSTPSSACSPTSARSATRFNIGNPRSTVTIYNLAREIVRLASSGSQHRVRRCGTTPTSSCACPTSARPRELLDWIGQGRSRGGPAAHDLLVSLAPRMSARATVVEAEHLQKTFALGFFRKKVRAVDDVSFDRRAAARSSASSAPTAPARPRR